MIKNIRKAIQKLGVKLIVPGKNGKAVIVPVMNAQKGAAASEHGRSICRQYYIYSNTELMQGLRYGDIVSDGKNEYYILWTVEVKSTCGDYTKTCVRLVERGEAGL